MRILENISTAVERAILSIVKSSTFYAEYYNRTDNKIDYTRQADNYSKKEIATWTRAVMAATDPDNPTRGELMRFYKSLMLDLHLGSCIDNRILPIQCAPFKLIDKNGDADEEAHKLLEKPWYLDVVRLICLHTFEGTKLIELFDLNENGELKEVNEIPQSNFIPQKGIVIKDEGMTQGVSYRDGAYKDYYIQIGGDWNLGLLNQLAMVVLAKKLGLGSWMNYIEKFGIPALFVVTERMDPTRRDELFAMLQAFKSNHFAVLQGNEKVESPDTKSVDGYQSFKALNETCNSELSKRILGGTGTTDEKSYVGSAEVHERLLKYRHQVDKLIFKFYFNEEIKPRLVKLSSVYKPLENLYFEFDESESLSLKDILEAVKELSQYYDFDVEELVRITGLPITAIKAATGNVPPTNPASTQKKKPNANVSQSLLYGLTDSLAINAKTWDAATEKVALGLYEGTLKPADLDKDLILKYYSALNKAAQVGYGKDYYNDEIARKIRNNLMKFSGAKAYTLMFQIQGIDAKAGMSKEAYIEQAKKLVSLHNETYMNVETQFASAKATAARDWQQYVKDVDIYPNLKCRTMEDENVRESHSRLDGLVKPVNQWTFTPPFEPRCRCWLEQTTEPTSVHTPQVSFNPQYANNPGITGEAFPEQHNYFVSINASDKAKVLDNTQIMKLFATYNRTIETKSGKKVLINDFADISDLNPNIKAAKTIANILEKDVFIRPHILIKGFKNPEFGIGTVSNIGDLKTYEPIRDNKPVPFENYIKNNMFGCNKQGCNYAVLDISKATESDMVILPEKLRGALFDKKDLNTNIKNVILIKDKKAGIISRSQLNGKNFREPFKDLF
jgi:hypothetical protein